MAQSMEVAAAGLAAIESRAESSVTTLAILALRNSVVFPFTVMPLNIGRPSSLRAIEEAAARQQAIGILAQRNPENDAPAIAELFEIGTMAGIIRIAPTRDGQRQIIVHGRQRFRVLEALQAEPYLIARVEIIEESAPRCKEFEAKVIDLREQAVKIMSLAPQPSAELKSTVESIEEPLALIDIVASILDMPTADKQEILATLDGVKEKILAAKRAGLSCVRLPELDRKDLTEIPPPARAGIRCEFLITVDEALRLALEPESAASLPASHRLAS